MTTKPHTAGALSTAPPLDAPTPRRRTKTADRLEGAILLGALGDAFGYRVEFLDRQTIAREFPDGFAFDRPEDWTDADGRHVVSDDTQMTLFTAEACTRTLAAGRRDPRPVVRGEMRLAYRRWYQTQTTRQLDGTGLTMFRSMFAQRAPGTTCLTALKTGGDGHRDRPINDSKGCGTVMRVAPIAFLPGFSDEEVFDIACDSSALTHGHVLGWASGGAMALLIRRIALGRTIAEAADDVVEFVRLRPGGDVIAEKITAAIAISRLPSIGADEIESLGAGWVAEEALAIGLAAALAHQAPQACLTLAANHAGDSDSTASIAGQILGTQLGRRQIEKDPYLAERIAKLDVIDALESVCGQYAVFLP